jgi:hypothetical protein
MYLASAIFIVFSVSQIELLIIKKVNKFGNTTSDPSSEVFRKHDTNI